MKFDDNIKKRYDVIEYIDAVANEKGNAWLKTNTFTDTDPVLISLWLQDLETKGLLKIMQRTDNGAYVVYNLNVKNPDFHEHVDEQYRWLQLSIDKLSPTNFLAVFDLAYELKQKFEVTQSNTLDMIGDTPNTKRFPQLNDSYINYRANAVQFLQEYGLFTNIEHDGFAFYKITVTRRHFDRTYQTILKRAIEDGYVSVRNKPVSNTTQPQVAKSDTETSKPQAKPSVAKVEIQHLQLKDYSDRTGVLTISSATEVAIAKRGKVKRSNGKRYDQCQLMSCLFKSVNSLKNGVSFSTFLGVKYNKNNKNQVKKIRNTIDEINKKVAEKTTAKRLIFTQAEKIFIDKSYL